MAKMHFMSLHFIAKDIFYSLCHKITDTVLKSQSFLLVPFPITANEVGIRKKDTKIFSNYRSNKSYLSHII